MLRAVGRSFRFGVTRPLLGHLAGVLRLGRNRRSLGDKRRRVFSLDSASLARSGCQLRNVLLSLSLGRRGSRRRLGSEFGPGSAGQVRGG